MSTGENDPDSPVSTVDENEGSVTEAEPTKPKLDFDVQINKVGPCKKHVTITIPRVEVDRQFDESLGTMKREALVPGFRPGHAPRTLVEKRYRKQVADQVKSTLMMGALERLDEDYKLNPITEPKLDVAAISIPDEGPFQFEIEIEVRPEFSLPSFKGLTIDRPVKTISEADVDGQLRLFLERHGQIVPKLEGGAEIGDYLTADLRFHLDGVHLNEVKEIQFRLQPELRFQDGSVPNVGEALVGVTPGEERETEAKIGSGSANPDLRGQSIRVTFKVHDLKQVRLPEVNSAFLSSIGFASLDELRQALREVLERRLRSQQRQAMRVEIMNRLIQETPFELPADLVARQQEATVRRLIHEMQQQGFSENDIRAREAEIRTNAREATQRSLTEYFILSQIAEAEGIKVEEEDIALEIEAIAERNDESPRRVRSRIEKEGSGDALATQILERKTLDRILESVTYHEVPLIDQEVAVETLDQNATLAPPPGESSVEGPGAEGANAEDADAAETSTEGGHAQGASEDPGV